MRRTLAGLLFGIAYVCAAIALGGWLLQRTAFDPSRTASSANVVLSDPRITHELADVIADATATKLGLEANKDAIRKTVEATAATPAGARLMAKILHDAHAHLIGEQREPVQITGPQMVQVVRNEAVADLPPITLPVPRIGLLDVIRQALRWVVPIAALVALVFAAVGLTAHPERSALFRSLGFGLLLLAVLVGLLGYVVPRFVVPMFSSSPWARVPIALVDDELPMLIMLELLLVGAGLALLAGSGMIRRRRRWSTPISTYRYAEERNWS